jgi:hypothetical protein
MAVHDEKGPFSLNLNSNPTIRYACMHAASIKGGNVGQVRGGKAQKETHINQSRPGQQKYRRHPER